MCFVRQGFLKQAKYHLDRFVNGGTDGRAQPDAFAGASRLAAHDEHARDLSGKRAEHAEHDIWLHTMTVKDRRS